MGWTVLVFVENASVHHGHFGQCDVPLTRHSKQNEMQIRIDFTQFSAV